MFDAFRVVFVHHWKISDSFRPFRFESMLALNNVPLTYRLLFIHDSCSWIEYTRTHTLWNWKANRKCKRLCGFDVSLHNEQPSIFCVSPKFAPRILYHFVSYLMEDIRWKIFQLMLYIVGAVSIRFFMCSVCLCVTVCAHIWARSVYFETVWRLCHYHTEKYHCE